MAVTDAELIAALLPPLLEDPTIASGLWTLTEVLGYLVERQNRFLAETGILVGIADLPWTPAAPTHALPPDWVSTVVARWHDLDDDTWTPLEATDSWEMDHLQGSQTPDTRPVAYRDADTNEQLVLHLAPTPQGTGSVELLYVPVAETLSGTGDLIDVPDDLALYLRYGVWADMLAKEGRGQDLLRSRYAELRFQEGIALARALLEGYA